MPLTNKVSSILKKKKRRRRRKDTADVPRRHNLNPPVSFVMQTGNDARGGRPTGWRNGLFFLEDVERR